MDHDSGTDKLERHLGRQLAAATLVFAVIVSLLVTGIDLWRAHEKDNIEIEHRLGLIATASLEAMAAALWSFESAHVKLLAEGIARQPDIGSVEVFDSTQSVIRIGKTPAGAIMREFTLAHGQSSDPIGRLVVAVDYASIHKRTEHRYLGILLSNLLLVALIAVFVLWLINRSVTRHVRQAALFVTTRNDANLAEELHFVRQLWLDGKDELDMLAAGIGRMQQTLRQTILDLREGLAQREAAEAQVIRLNAELEERVAERTEELLQTNDELEAMVENLKATQEQLVQSEKLAALGNLVAGVAHELNTPIGNGLMAVTTLRDRLLEFRKLLEAGLSRATFDDFVAGVDAGSDIALRNLRRAAELITSFKQVAVDQTSSQRRAFRVREVVDEILMTLHPTLKRTPYRIETEIPDELELDSYPGPLGQVLANLINNAVIHGFEARDHGTIRITAAAQIPGRIVITVRDDGKGIPADRIGRIFDPFFTTRMGRGGTGLGLHVVHSLVTNVLGGAVTVNSREGQGTEFVIGLPERAPILAMAG